jgi:predicted PurR-regulated permease PerM
VGDLFTEFLLMVFCLIFLLSQGNKIWTFLLGAVHRRVRHRVDLAGRSGFTTLARYVRGTAAVAVVDAVGIGVGLVILGVPLAAPLSTLVLFGAFIPVVGSVVAGAVAVLVAGDQRCRLGDHRARDRGRCHAAGKPCPATFLLGRAVRLHPLAVVLALATGLVTAGIVGVLFAVSLLAVLSTASPHHHCLPPATDPTARPDRN